MTGLLSVAGSTPSEGFELTSCRFDALRTTKLTRTPVVAGNRRTWTFSCWFKWVVRDQAYTQFFDGGGASTSECTFYIMQSPTNYIQWSYWNGSSEPYKLKTNQVLHDPSAWYHFVAVQDTTQETASNRLKMYLNGEQITSFSTANYPSLNLECPVNDTYEHAIGSWESGAGRYFSGYLAEIYLIDGSALTPASFGETNSKTNQWQPKNPTDIKPTLKFGVNGFYTPFSNNALATSFTDAADRGVHTMVAGGNVHTDTTTKKIGTASAQFDGTGDYLYVADSNTTATTSDFVFTGDFTVEGWVYPNSSGSGEAYLIAHWKSGAYSSGWAVQYDHDNNKFAAWVNFSTSAGNTETLTQSGTSAEDAWYHIALTRSGNTYTLWLDGVSQATATNAGTLVENSAVYLGIGAGVHTGGASYYLDGFIDEVRISDTTRYTTNFTPSITAFTADANTLLLLHMDGANDGTTFTDSSWTESGPRHTITASGDVTNTRVSNHSASPQGNTHLIGPKITGHTSVLAYDGNGDYLRTPSSSDFNLGSGNWTVECWFNGSAWPASIKGLISLDYDGPGASHNAMNFGVDNSKLAWLVSDTSLNWAIVNTTGGTVSTAGWHHAAGVFDGSTYKAYLDGIEVISVTSSTAVASQNSSQMIIGSTADANAGQCLFGYQDEIRVSDSARYTSNFTPSTDPFTSDSNTMLLIQSNTTMGSTTITDSSSSAHTITVNGDVMHVAPKIGVGMGSFDGASTDWVSIADSDDWYFAAGPFTLECWVCWPGAVVAGQILSQYDWGNSNRSWVMSFSGANLELTYSTTGGGGPSSKQETWSPSADTWYHIAIARDSSSNLRFFVDGTELGSATTVTASFYQSSAALSIANYLNSGSGHTTPFTGFMDELRISRVARYTGTFTPSTTAFKDDKDTVLLMHMDGGGGIDPDTNLPTLPGEGTYFFDDSVDALFYDSATGIPTNKSMISFDGTGDYLTSPDSTEWDVFESGSVFTLEAWVKYSSIPTSSTYNDWFCQQEDASNGWRFGYDGTTGTGGLWIWMKSGGSTVVDYIGNSSTAYKISDGMWHHVAMTKSGSAIKAYLDGVEVISATDADSDTFAAVLGVGGGSVTAAANLNGNMDQVRISDNIRYGAAFTPTTTPFTADANTLLLIQSDWSEGGLGADHSGNYNYWTPINLTVNDMVPDSPMNNFSTLNPLAHFGSGTFSEGNLKISGGNNTMSTFAPTSGKWYWEVYIDAVSSVGNHLGVMSTDYAKDSDHYNEFDIIGCRADGYDLTAVGRGQGITAVGSNTATLTSFVAGDIISFELNLDTPQVIINKNNNPIMNRTFTYDNTYPVLPWIRNNSSNISILNCGQDSSFVGNLTAQGYQDQNDKGDFYYAPPTGFLALCADNLSATLITLPTDHFVTTLYTGNGTAIGSGGKTISGLSFKPDLTWFKNRDTTDSFDIYDAVRGVTKRIRSDSPSSANCDAQSTQAEGLTAFNSDGWTMGNRDNVNVNAEDYVTWSWLGDGVAGVLLMKMAQ